MWERLVCCWFEFTLGRLNRLSIELIFSRRCRINFAERFWQRTGNEHYLNVISIHFFIEMLHGASIKINDMPNFIRHLPTQHTEMCSIAFARAAMLLNVLFRVRDWCWSLSLVARCHSLLGCANGKHSESHRPKIQARTLVSTFLTYFIFVFMLFIFFSIYVKDWTQKKIVV